MSDSTPTPSPDPAAKPSYKDSLNLPKTSFSMKANLIQSEPQSLTRWEESHLFGRLQTSREHAEPFVFHDGPPYANGAIHMGHLLNKVLKDFVVRGALMEGRRVRYVPGWDTHGLPIEHKVMTELHEKGKTAKLDTLEPEKRHMAIRRECAAAATKFIGLQALQMKRLLTIADYADPYYTLMPVYEAKTLEVFADLFDQGVVVRALKPVHWSIANKTALAEAELEYEDRQDLSVYVDFEASDRAKVAAAFGLRAELAESSDDADELDESQFLDVTPSFMIWTTTPWTLPANLAIAVHERARYSLVEIDGNTTIVASEMVEKVAKKAGAEKVTVRAETDGASLVGLSYQHPFCARTGNIVSADYVTLEDGTGLVHTAPGHGADDYRTGLRVGLPAYCPVREDGTYDDSVPEWLRGKSIWTANAEITEHLRTSGHLFYDHTFTHSYPHDWRSKTPVIFRATEQWFIGVDAPMKRDGVSLRARNIGYPSELYLEGSDQHRGWFQLSLLPALAATGIPPFKRLVTHGFIVDKHGKKMSKSLGNTIEVEALLKEFGADVCRWWVAGTDYENDIRADTEFFKVAGESYRKVRNTVRFLLSNLEGYDATETESILGGIRDTSLEAWMLAQVASVQEVVRSAMTRCAFREAQQAIFTLCNDVLSSVYCAATKDRLYCDARNSARRRATQAAMFRATDAICRMLAPFVPHTADEAYRSLMRDDTACIHLECHHSVIQPCSPRWSEVLALREVVHAALERAKERGIDNSLDAGVLLPETHGHLADFIDDLPDLLGVSRVIIARDQREIEVVDLRDQPRCERSWKRDTSVRLRADGGMLSDRDAAAMGV